MKVFIDSNYFIALNNPLDSQYEKAQQVSKSLFENVNDFHISDLIFLEIVTVLSRKVNRIIAVSVGNALMHKDNLHIISFSKQINTRTWTIFQEIKSKNISFVDCSILACLEYEDIDKLVTFDQKDFFPLQKAYRFKLYGK